MASEGVPLVRLHGGDSRSSYEDLWLQSYCIRTSVRRRCSARQGKIESGKRVNTRQVVPHSPSSATHTTCMAGNDIRLE